MQNANKKLHGNEKIEKIKTKNSKSATGNGQPATFSLPSRDEASSTIIMRQQKSTRGVARSQVAAK